MIGLYIHVPFCMKKCLYCDFYSETDRTRTDDYVRALTREIHLKTSESTLGKPPVDTIYFGGGTPSILDLGHLDTVLSTIHDHYHVLPDAEITFEANPGTLDEEKLKGLKQLGVNRLSLGVQSFDDSQLSFLGRIHDAAQAESLIRSAQKTGFDNLSLDLIYGLPAQDLQEWFRTLDRALAFDPAHLSCYMLTLEPGTPLFVSMERGAFTPMDEKKSELFFLETLSHLESRGFDPYEISNFARSRGFRSRHNLKYWHFKAYTGFGPSAHSYEPEQNLRYWNIADLKAYTHMLGQGKRPVGDQETLTLDQQITETLFLGLRTREGICLSDFIKRFNRDFRIDYKDILVRLEQDGLAETGTDHVRLTKKGMVLSDRVTSLFVNHTA